MKATNPYQSPDAAIRNVDRPPPEQIPEHIRKNIRNGAIAGVISCLLTLGMTVFFVLNPQQGQLFDAWNFLDVGLIAAMTFGIWRKSRVAATAMFLYFAFSKILIVVETGKPSGLLVGLIFLYVYAQAMRATYQYHRLLKEWRRTPVAMPPPPLPQTSPPELPAEPSSQA